MVGEMVMRGAVCPAAGEQPEVAAAEVVALLVAGMLNGCGRPHGPGGAEEAGMELLVGLRDLRLREGEGGSNTPNQAAVRGYNACCGARGERAAARHSHHCPALLTARR